jgi:hypothetical protein
MILLPNDAWEVRTTAKKGRGVFATKDIAPGTIIGDYIGKVIKTAEEDTTEGDEGLYLMYYHDYASLYPEDINAPGIHLLNHSCTPNTWMYTYYGHTLFFALRHIFKGEEITVSYLLGPKEDCDEPCKHDCHCGSEFCTGTMHLSKERFEKWNAFNLHQMEQTKRKRIQYGKVLPKLDAYPKSIPDDPMYDLFGSMEKEPFRLESKKLPTVAALRKLIRETGRTIAGPTTTIFGIQNNVIIQK